MLSIRPATEQDAASIAHVHVRSWQTTYAGIVPQEYLAALDETERERQWQEWLTLAYVFVAESNEEVVGFIAGGPMREPIQDYDAELFAIYLLQEAQGRGTGTALLVALAEALRNKGFKSMAVWVLESNSSSRFYEKSGGIPLSSKEVEIGGVFLPARAYGWPDLEAIRA